jgi:hypothetical protein
MFATVLAVGIAGTAGYFVGLRYSEAKLIEGHLAPDLARRVHVLQEHRSQLPKDVVVMMQAELPRLIARLDESLESISAVFLASDRIKSARDSGLVYLKVYPPKRSPVFEQRELEAALRKRGFYNNPAAEGWMRNRDIADEERVARLLEQFDPKSLSPENNELYTKVVRDAAIQGNEKLPASHTGEPRR